GQRCLFGAGRDTWSSYPSTAWAAPTFLLSMQSWKMPNVPDGIPTPQSLQTVRSRHESQSETKNAAKNCRKRLI
ncbi:hypothetical protein, partial [Salmonella enterica]|uniref:hypothetical protein n=1 Tax=Salmonella enterica TaxID=28901 RepID=UPI0027E5499C